MWLRKGPNRDGYTVSFTASNKKIDVTDIMSEMIDLRPTRNVDHLEPYLTIFLGQWPMIIMVLIIVNSSYKNVP